jgi:hypothetical protein
MDQIRTKDGKIIKGNFFYSKSLGRIVSIPENEEEL